MKKYLIGMLLSFVVLGVVSNADELRMKDVNDLIYEDQKKVVLIDKEDLGDLIISNNNEKAREIRLKQSKVVRSYSEYISLLKSEDDQKFIVSIEMDLVNLLEVTKYLFSNKMEEGRYELVKPLLIAEGKKYPKIDQEEFLSGVMNMNATVATDMYNDIYGFIRKVN